MIPVHHIFHSNRKRVQVGKHHRKHNRSASNYPERLETRGISSAQARMPFFDNKGHKHNTMEAANRASGRGWKEKES